MSLGHSPRIITDGLALYLDAANLKSLPSNTIWYDLSGNGLDVTLLNSPSQSTNYLAFNGTTQAGYIPYDARLSPTSQITLSAWVTTDWQTTGNVRVLSKTESGGYQLSINDISGQVGCTIHVGGTYRYCTVAKATVTSGWHHMLATCDGRYIKLYFDSVLVATTDLGSYMLLTYTYNNNLVIASEAGAGSTNSIAANYILGSIGTVQIYNRALSIDEIRQNFNALRGRYGI